LEYLSPLGKIVFGIHFTFTVIILMVILISPIDSFSALVKHPILLALLFISSWFAYFNLKEFLKYFFPQYRRKKLQKLFSTYFNAPTNIYVKTYTESDFGVTWYRTEIIYPETISMQEFQTLQTQAENLGIIKDLVNIESESVRRNLFVAHFIKKPDPYEGMTNQEKVAAINYAVNKEIQESSVITFGISANELLKRLKQTSR